MQMVKYSRFCDQWNGKVVAITGVGGGVGSALAHHLISCGALVEGIDVRQPGNVEPGLSFTQGDIRDQAVTDDWARDIASRHGGGIAGLINNAGALYIGAYEDMAADFFMAAFETNLLGAVNCTRSIFPLLSSESVSLKYPRFIANINSAFAHMTTPHTAPYSVAKAGLRLYTDALRQHTAGRDIHVCHVVLGGIRTGIEERAISSFSNNSDLRQFQQFFRRRVARTKPEDAARRIIRLMTRHHDIAVGADARLAVPLLRLTGALYSRHLHRL